MEKFLVEENGEYGLDCSKAVWATDQMHQAYHEVGVILSDADFVIEDAGNIMMLVEYKNAKIEKAIKFSDETKPFNPMDNTKIQAIARKFYDSCHYLYLLCKLKPIQYVYVVETPNDDSTMRKRLRDRIKKQLPFELQQNMNTGIKLVDKVDVVSIEEWNEDSTYGKYPLVKIDGEGV